MDDPVTKVDHRPVVPEDKPGARDADFLVLLVGSTTSLLEGREVGEPFIRGPGEQLTGSSSKHGDTSRAKGGRGPRQKKAAPRRHDPKNFEKGKIALYLK
jgi:hypothetical protein